MLKTIIMPSEALDIDIVSIAVCLIRRAEQRDHRELRIRHMQYLSEPRFEQESRLSVGRRASM